MGATESVVPQQDCVAPSFVFGIEGEYFQNKSERLARINFTPVPGSGAGIIHETSNDPDQNASGTLVVMGTDLQQYEIHLLDYDGATLFQPQRSFGTIVGDLDAELTACGERIAYEGTISFTWFPVDDGGEEGF